MKERLMTPGPTAIPERVFRAMAHPAMHHRTETFREIFTAVQEGLRSFLDLETLPILLASSGTGAMESALVSLCRRGDSIITLNAGKFGERWSDIARRLGVSVHEVVGEWGSSPSPEAVSRVLAEHPDAVCFCVQQCETSTTVNHPIRQLSQMVRDAAPNMLFVVDAISSLGTAPLSVARDGIDVVVGGSQKALMLPPGLALLGLSARAWEAVERKGAQEPAATLYFDLLTEREAQAKGAAAWTPAMNIILGLHEVLAMLREEGHEQVFERHRRASRAARAGLKALGFSLLAERHPSPAVTGGFPPDGIDANALRNRVYDAYGVRIAGGQGQYKGKIVRIGHMGYFDRFDILTAIAAVEYALHDLRPERALGEGIIAAARAYLEGVENG